MHQPTACLNCGTSITHTANFCLHCGQSTHHHRLNLGHLGHEVIHFFTHADKGIFYLVRMLVTKPGIVLREYIAGRRKKYFNPLNFFFITIGLFVFAQTTFHPMQAINLDEAKAGVARIPERTVRERRLAKLERIEKATNFMAKNSNYVNMAITPLVALIFFLGYRKEGYNYTEHLVAQLYLAGINALVYIIFITPYLVAAKNTDRYLWGIYGFLFWEIVYRAVVFYRFLRKNGLPSLLYALAISFVAVASWYVLSRSIIGFYIEKGF